MKWTRGPQLATAVALVISSPLLAQEQRSNNEPIDEIIVTVERFEQSLQDVASLAQAFTAEDLKMAGVGTELRNLSVVVPGLNVANQEGNLEIFIRGVGTANNTELGDPSAATHINGIYLPRPRGLGAMFFDLERVEVNKGPQGTLRGRNAVAGTLNVVTRRPELGEWGGYVEAGFGEYDSRTVEAAINVPLGETAALRLAGYHDEHDSYFRNAGLQDNLTPAGVEDEQAGRLSALWRPTDNLSILLVGDYIQEGGTGYPGANMFGAFQAGFRFDDVNPRAIVNRGWQGELDSRHWGIQTQVLYDMDAFGIEYSGSYRDLDFEQINAQSDGIAFPDRDLTAVDYDNWGNVFWLTRSESMVHELRLVSPEDSRARWTTGVFYFKEDQEVGFFSTADHGYCCYSGTEFTMPDVQGESLAGFADLTFAVTDTFRLKGGLRYTTEEKSRYGIGGNFAIVAGGEGFSCCFSTRFSTPGFQPLFVDRPYFDATRDGRSREELANLILSGVRFGARDTLDDQLAGVPDGTRPNGTCIDTPDLDNGSQNCPPNGQFSFLNITAPEQQQGEYEDSFLDWRIGAEFDLTADSLLYASITTGHKSGGFNDTLTNPDFDPTAPEGEGNPRYLVPREFSPEEVVAYEIGTKNRFGRAIVNASAFYYDYQDQVFQVLTVIGGTDGDNSGSSQQNVNIANSRIFGVELESSVPLGAGFSIGGNLLWLDTKIEDGVISDVRATNFENLDRTPDVDLSGNELPKAPEFTLIGRLQQVIDLGSGASIDWQVLANYTDDYFLTIYNEADVFIDTNGDGFPDTYESARTQGFDELQEGFWTVNLGAGYTSPSGALRVEGFVSNLFDEDASNKAQFNPNLNLRFLNDPRTMGVRLRYQF